MPANLTPQYLEAEEKYRQAKTPQERLEALKEMLKTIPKHKGTEKIQADIKKKIAETKKLLESQKSGKKRGVSYKVDNNGFPQVVIIGPPNSGRSLLISNLTGVELKVADYPFTTRIPQPAMMKYENIKIQLVDTPPISKEHMEPWLPGIVRAGDVALIVVDLNDDEVLENIEIIEEHLKKQRVYLNKKTPLDEDDRFGIIKDTLIVANKCDIEGSEEILELLKEEYGKKYDIISISALKKVRLEELKKAIFELLKIIRIYPKPPGKKPDLSNPIILKKGSTVVDLADSIHHELAKKMKSVRVWNSSQYSDGQWVPMDYILEDENIIEIETSLKELKKK